MNLLKTLKKARITTLKSYLKYDKKGYTYIYKYKKSLQTHKFLKYSLPLITLTNISLLLKEQKDQIFNLQSKIGFYFLSIFGFIGYIGFGVYSRRMVRSIKWHFDKKKVILEFFPFFQKKSVFVYYVSDLSRVSHFFLNYDSFDSRADGPLFVNFKENELGVYPGMDELVRNVLVGNKTVIDDVDRKLEKYKKLK